MGRIHVLCVDDDASFAGAVASYLDSYHDEWTTETVNQPRSALETIDAGHVDCIVSDYNMPAIDGLELLTEVRNRESELPFILFTGRGSEEIASEAISAGVTDYIQKGGLDQFAVLANRIEHAVNESRAETRLRERERRLDTLTNNLPGMVYRARDEPDWPFEFASRGCHELTGYDPEQFVDGDVVWGTDVVHPDDAGALATTIDDVSDADGERFEHTYRIVDRVGEIKWVLEQGCAVVDERTGGEFLEGYITDVSDQHTLRSAIERERAFVDGVSRAIDDAICAFDTDGRLIRGADRIAALTGYDAGDLETEHVSAFVDDAERVLEAFETIVERGTPRSVAFSLRTDDGTSTPTTLTGAPFETEDRTVGVCGIVDVETT
ncbi:PAS domain-containing response regulator [Natrononativus amylolyticus]|uniref:PAS domain-containing response regulator n=1 Tax=Natrononativus amylolyticus TaxID=2963434 RepID=UPI0020CBD49D|nr:response regulator [Natrononativus amylolyticus]